MAKEKKQKPSVIWTVCYMLWEDGHEDDPFTATWFAFGRNESEAKENFLKDFRNHPDDFYGATEKTNIYVSHAYKGFSC